MSKSIFEIRESKSKSKAADELMAYAKKNGGIDKKDFMKAAGYMGNYASTGNPGVIADLAKLLGNLDTEPMEKIISVMHKNDPALAKSVMRKAGIKLREEVELEEAAPKISTGKAKGSITATGMRGKGMKKFDVNVSVKGGKLEFRIKDEQGKFQTVGIKQAARMLGESASLAEAKEPASPDEGSMATRQLEFMSDAIEDIMEHIEEGGDFPEWMQNKLTEAHTKIKDLYASVEGSEEEVDESTKAYGKSQEKMRDKKKNDAITPKDKATLGKIAALLAKEKK